MTPERIEKERRIRERFSAIKSTLTERARRLFVANEAIAYGYGGIAAAFRATGLAPSSIGKGIKEVHTLEAEQASRLPSHRSRRAGAGRKKTTDKDPALVPHLKELVESSTRGDPQSALLWTARSQRNIVDALKAQGHQTSTKMVARLLINWATACRVIANGSKGLSTRIATHSSNTSTRRCAASWPATSQSSRSTPRRRNWWGRIRTQVANCGPRAIRNR